MVKQYRVLIIEDEAHIRRLLRKYIELDYEHYAVAGECHNGLKGLEFIKKDKVDIVITDIQMPVMDGIEFIKKALAYAPELKIIVLTAYSSFELVRECFLLGAVNYIVKTEIDSDGIVKVLDDVVSRIPDSTDKLKVMTENLIGNKFVDSKLVEDITSMGIDLKNGNIRIIDIKIRNFKTLLGKIWNYDEMTFSYGIENILTEVLSSFPVSFVSYYKYNGEFVVLISLQKIRSEMQILRFVFEFFQKFETSLTALADICVTMGVSSHFSSSKSYNELYVEAKNANAVNFFKNKSNCLFYDKKYIDLICESDFSGVYHAFKNILNPFSSDFPKKLPLIFVSPDEENIHNIKFLKSNIERVYYEAVSYCAENGKTDKFSESFLRYEECLREGSCFDELFSWLSDIYDKLFAELLDDTGIVYEIKSYVEKNEDKQPMLMDFATEKGMSPSYLSKVFKKETGMNFTDYVTASKMKKSVVYMQTTDMNITEISYTLGYSNVETFSRVFKRFYNQTPKNYLKNLRKK